MMKAIGLTGGIGAGKSEVAQILRGIGIEVIDADQLGHHVYLPHSDGWRAVVEAFGEGILRFDGTVDRSALGSLVFSDSEALVKLNSITHPRIYRKVKDKLEELRSEDKRVVVVEAALLIEAGWTDLVDEVWVITAPEELVIRRLRRRSGMSRESARSRLRSQLSSEERILYADVVIVNDEGFADLDETVLDVWRKRIEGKV
jgi:dephospho-CoA kinase